MTSRLLVDKIEGKATSGIVQMPAGHVMQTVEGSFSTKTATTSTSLVTTGLEATITPSSTSNKVLISVAVNGVYSPETDYVVLHIYKNDSNHHSFSTNVGQNGENDSVGVAHFYLDSPSTISATKYTVYNRSGNGGSVGINNYGIGGNGSTRSTILLQEIAG